ncbi:Rho GTPase-activating protein 20 [Liparis tanakae]|uniref:Rho GTPase-activating protein 20 n=1 Tax=Liparis tanakae TaxID=230148 RepID=A0A4Z2ETA8_9TELE|nr:Rho GTPase-activating protein 20 [Liparis tanakae]
MRTRTLWILTSPLQPLNHRASRECLRPAPENQIDLDEWRSPSDLSCPSSLTPGSGPQVCELVKFMIEHCEQIVGEDPSSLFGGPPRRLAAEETGSDPPLDPLTDSSYDSLENELDSPRRARTRQDSLDSILTFSDYDPDPPEPRRDAPAADASSALELLSLDRRRKSAPAIAYATEFRPRGAPAASSSGDSLDSLSSAGGRLPSRSPPSRLPLSGTRGSAGGPVAPGGAAAGCGGRHPNAWLKNGRRLSLTQPEAEKWETSGRHGERGGAKLPPRASRRGSKDAGRVKGRPGPKPPPSCSPPSHHRSTGSLQLPTAPWLSSSDGSPSSEQSAANPEAVIAVVVLPAERAVPVSVQAALRGGGGGVRRRAPRAPGVGARAPARGSRRRRAAAAAQRPAAGGLGGGVPLLPLAQRHQGGEGLLLLSPARRPARRPAGGARPGGESQGAAEEVQRPRAGLRPAGLC